MVSVDLAEQFLREPTDVNFFALMGSLAGMTVPLSDNESEKDFRTYSETPGLQELARFYDVITGRRRTP